MRHGAPVVVLPRLVPSNSANGDYEACANADGMLELYLERAIILVVHYLSGVLVCQKLDHLSLGY